MIWVRSGTPRHILVVDGPVNKPNWKTLCGGDVWLKGLGGRWWVTYSSAGYSCGVCEEIHIYREPNPSGTRVSVVGGIFFVYGAHGALR